MPHMRMSLALVVAAAVTVAATPAVPSDQPSSSTVTVDTLHHLVPSGVLTASVEIDGGCAYGDVAELSCTIDEATGRRSASGEVLAASLGVSATHRTTLVAPDGSRVEMLDVEVHDSGELEVRVTVPVGFESRIVAAPGAQQLGPMSAVWPLGHVEPGRRSFELQLDSAPVDASELLQVDLTLVRGGVPLVASGLAEVSTQQGRQTTRITMQADRDVPGATPVFEAPALVFGTSSGGECRARFEHRMVSSGTYSGAVQGHVGTRFDPDDLPGSPCSAGLGRTGMTTWLVADETRTTTEVDRDGIHWRTNNAVPLDHHDVITAGAVGITHPQPVEEVSPSAGDLPIEDDDGRLVVRRHGPATWGVGHASISLVAHVPGDFPEPPSRAGFQAAAQLIVLRVEAVGGDVDNRTSAEPETGDPIVITAPDGWHAYEIAWGPTHRVDVDLEFGTDDQGRSTVTATPVVLPGKALPDTYNGFPYYVDIAVSIVHDQNNEPTRGIGGLVPPAPSPFVHWPESTSVSSVERRLR